MLRKRSAGRAGQPEDVENFMFFIAEELREIMARLGFRTLNEMVGRVDKLEPRKAINHWKATGLDLSPLLWRPEVGDDVGTFCSIAQDHGLDASLDRTTLLDLAQPALERGEPVKATLPIHNVNRVVGTMVGSELTRRYGAGGLPDGTRLTRQNCVTQNGRVWCKVSLTDRPGVSGYVSAEYLAPR